MMNPAKLMALLEHDCHLVVLESTTSTNDEVVRRFEKGKAAEGVRFSGVTGGRFPCHTAPASTVTGGRFPCHTAPASDTPLVVVSAAQTAGRGRLGRTWVSPPGGVYLSVLFELGSDIQGEHVTGGRFPCHMLPCHTSPCHTLASLSPLTALSLRLALQQFTEDEVCIKWPNDIVSAHGKLAGILVEVKQGTCVVIGVGINVNRPGAGAFEGAGYLNDEEGRGSDPTREPSSEPSSDPPREPSSDPTREPSSEPLRDPPRALSREAVAAAAINSLLSHYQKWCTGGCSFVPFASAYREHMVLLGEQVCVRDATGVEVASGIVEGVDGQGHLLLAGAQGVRAVPAGEVTLRNV